MTPSPSRDSDPLQRLEDALVDDILAASDDDILAEARADGAAPETVADAMRARFERVVRRRERRNRSTPG